MIRLAPTRFGRALRMTTIAAVAVACAPAADDAEEEEDAVPQGAMAALLADGQAVFGIFSGEHTPEGGAAMAANREVDFVFYSLESGPFDIPAMEAYMAAMAEAAGAAGTHPVALRIPPIRDGVEPARERVAQGLAAGVEAVVFPHVESAEEAAVAVGAMGEDGWPANPGGRLVNVLIIEDQVGIENAREIVSTPGVGVAIPGPGDLRRAYEGDMVAVENAIQTVLGHCKAFDVPCGITAGVDDIAERLEQGFRLIIVTQPDAVAVGRQAAGRAG